MNFCSIASGSSGNCIYAGSDHGSILVDVGISGKKVEAGLNSIGMTTKDMDAILLTHEHSDHIKGLGVLSRKYGIPIYGTRGTLESVRESDSLGKIDADLFHEIRADERFVIKDLEILPFSTSHDAADPVAYRIEHADKAVGVVTDLGVYSDYTVARLQNLDAVLLEANHDIRMLQVGKYPYYLKQRILGKKGHLSNENAGRLLCEILHDRLKTILLGHLSKENNYEELAYQTVCAEVTLGDNPYKAGDFEIRVAKREIPSALIAV
ncbi:MAG: MBL fold metallo-hydrolase [Lachnospiraceae bacterium]|nr:MBL fold metallo-hydrolase [Robinsoniella sp.]MDY3765340.1 MBL fold metallo-hydrolase [Lachnospiraceae bacterium]